MTSASAGIMPATGNGLMPQMRKPVASMISPPQAGVFPQGVDDPSNFHLVHTAMLAA